ncbi:MAG: NAD-dependent epimerase/dehydratase family protein [bacterium]
MIGRRLLILGGTVFLGRHLVEAALARGHAVTLFNRGQHNPGLFPEVEKLRGDRDGNLTALRGRSWDAVIDTCGYVPRIVQASAELLADAVRHYTFISSISVYEGPESDENGQVGRLQDERVEEITGQTYGPLKALCERAAEQAMPGRVLNVRAGVIVGPHDPRDRFTYWIRRVAGGGEVLAPGRAERSVQFIDVRDLAGWIIRAVENTVTGVYNATGPGKRLTMGELLADIRSISGSGARFVWIDETFLMGSGVVPWVEMPLWAPETRPAAALISSVDSGRAIAAGLTYRPVGETIRDTLAWDASWPPDAPLAAGLTRQREHELLLAWRARSQTSHGGRH